MSYTAKEDTFLRIFRFLFYSCSTLLISGVTLIAFFFASYFEINLISYAVIGIGSVFSSLISYKASIKFPHFFGIWGLFFIFLPLFYIAQGLLNDSLTAKEWEILLKIVVIMYGTNLIGGIFAVRKQ